MASIHVKLRATALVAPSILLSLAKDAVGVCHSKAVELHVVRAIAANGVAIMTHRGGRSIAADDTMIVAR